MQGATQGIGERIVTAWRGLAPRERWLLALLALVALVTLLVMSADWSGRQREAYALAAADLTARKDLAVAGGRRAAAGDADRLRLMSQRSIQGSDIWMARVGVEQHLSAAATAAGLVSPRITVADAAEGDAQSSVIRAEITAPYDGPALVRLLESLSSDPRAYAVDSLVADKGEAAEFTLGVSFPVQIADGAPGA